MNGKCLFLVFFLFVSSLSFLPIQQVYASQTVTYQISQSSDDAQRYDTNSFDTAYNESSIGVDATDFNEVGLRFQNVQVPQGVKLWSAKLTFVCKTSTGFPFGATRPVARYRYEDNANASTFTDLTDFNSKTKSTSYVSQSMPSWSAGNSYDSADLSGLLEEFFSNSSWVSGNSLVIFWDYTNSPNRANRAYSYDSDSTKAVTLTIEYYTTYTVTFYYNLQSEQATGLKNPYTIWVNGTTWYSADINGSQVKILEGTAISLFSAMNSTYIFKNFTIYNNTVYTTNPTSSDWIMPKNAGNGTIWTYVELTPTRGFATGLGSGFILALLIGVALGMVGIYTTTKR